MTDKIRIGLVDYRLDIAHAPGFLLKLRQRQKEEHQYQGEIVACTAMDGDQGAQWARKNSLDYVSDPDQMRGEVDAIIIPASSNPEVHLELLESCAHLGVPVYVDKPFAHDVSTAQKLFDVARSAGIPIASSSILRFAREIHDLRSESTRPDFVQTWGGDNERYDEFLIHPVEMACTLMGGCPVSVRKQRVGETVRIQIQYSDGRHADAFFSPKHQNYEATICHQNGWTHRTLSTDFWVPFLGQLLESFALRQSLVSESETMNVMKILAAAQISEEGRDVTIF